MFKIATKYQVREKDTASERCRLNIRATTAYEYQRKAILMIQMPTQSSNGHKYSVPALEKMAAVINATKKFHILYRLMR